MTNQDAAKRIKDLVEEIEPKIIKGLTDADNDIEAIKMAIRALEEKPTFESRYLTNCQKCKSDYSRGYDDGYAQGYKDGSISYLHQDSITKSDTQI